MCHLLDLADPPGPDPIKKGAIGFCILLLVFFFLTVCILLVVLLGEREKWINVINKML
jgi:hypothetical protein